MENNDSIRENNIFNHLPNNGCIKSKTKNSLIDKYKYAMYFLRKISVSCENLAKIYSEHL